LAHGQCRAHHEWRDADAREYDLILKNKSAAVLEQGGASCLAKDFLERNHIRLGELDAISQARTINELPSHNLF
jgi:hypothetical protein